MSPPRISDPGMDTPVSMRLPDAIGPVDEAARLAAGLHCPDSGAPCPTLPIALEESRRRATQGAIQRQEIRELRGDLRASHEATSERLDRLERSLRATRWRSLLGTSGASWLGSVVIPWVLYYALAAQGARIPPPPAASSPPPAQGLPR